MSTTPTQSLPLRAAPVEGSLDLLALWRTLRKYWMLAASVAIAVTVGVAFYTLGQKKIYESGATVQFDPNPPRPLGQKVEQVVEIGSGTVWDTREYYETQYKIIQSMKVSLAVVGELGLNRDMAFIRNLPPGAVPPPGAAQVSEEDAADMLRSRVRVDPIKSSRLASVRLEDANPERAARLLSALVDAYVAQNIDDALASTNSAGDWLRDQLDKLKGELETNEMALHEYKERKNILSVAFDDRSNMLREQMGILNQQLTNVRTKREEVAARRAELAKVPSDNPSELPASELLQSMLLQNLRQKYIDAVRERDALTGAGKGANHPEVAGAQARVDASKSALLSEVKNIQGALDRDLSALRRQDGGLSGLFESAKKEALDLNLLEIEYNRLRQSKENTEKVYSMVLERTKESDLTRVLRVNNIRIVDRPRVPRGPIRPNLPLNVAGGLALGLLLGIAAAIGRGALDRTIKTPEDVEQLLQASFLGLIPDVDDNVNKGRRRANINSPGGPELVVHDNPRSGTAEAARSIRTNLMFMAPDNPYKALLVTSAGPAEGKTTVACCIAIAIAQAGKRVALIDCDLRRPRIHRIFKKGSEAGLTTALLDNNLDDVLQSTGVPNLSVMAAGPLPPNPAELFHSERFKSLLQRIVREYDQVIIDSPPLVAVTDAAILSTQVDGTVLVVRAFQTRKELAQHARRSLSDIGASLAGVVLNAVNLSRDEYKYSYHYYRRDSYYTEPAPTAKGGAGQPQPPANVS